MDRVKGRAASGFRSKLHSRAASLSLECLDMSRAVGRESLYIPKLGPHSLVMSRAKGRATSRFRPKLHSRTESLNLESLDIPKLGRENLDMGRESLDTDFRDPCPDFRDKFLVCPDFRGPRRDSCQDFPDSNSRRDYAIWI